MEKGKSRLHAEYLYTEEFEVDSKVLRDFHEYGYILLRNVFSSDEMSVVMSAVNDPSGVSRHSYSISTGPGDHTGTPCCTRLTQWNQPGSDITGLLARVNKTARTMQQLLGDEVYHYYSILMMKDPGNDGWNWHQDYRYWYHNDCLFPDMATAYIALDDCQKANGCLQIVECSHTCGRIEHRQVGVERVADSQRVADIQTRLPTTYVEMRSGDVLFFHSNVLHRSSANLSEMRRWTLLVAYNTKHNDPAVTSGKCHLHPQYNTLDVVDNSAILNCSRDSISSTWRVKTSSHQDQINSGGSIAPLKRYNSPVVGYTPVFIYYLYLYQFTLILITQ